MSGRWRVRAAAALLTSIVLALAACQSIPRDRVAVSGTEDDFLKLDAAELDLLALRLAPNPGRLAAVREDLKRSAERFGANQLYQARIAGLQGQAALLAGDVSLARAFAENAARLSDAEEGGWLVRAALEADAGKRLALLDQGLLKADRRFRLLCERGETLIRLARFAEATQDLDEGLRGLDERYRALYGPDRDHALSLAQAERDTGTTAVLTPSAAAEPLTIRAMVERAFTGTRLLTTFSPLAAPSFESVRPSLAAAGFFLQPDPVPSSPCARKDAAFFLWQIVVHAERNPKLVGQYRQKFTTSPVTDVPVESPWFEAVLGVVEREIMDLPDGVKFKPDAPMTGIEYLQALARLSKLYR